MLTEEELSEGFALGDWIVYPKRHVVAGPSGEVTPEHKVFQLLMLLAQAGGDVVTREDMIRDIWDDRLTGDDSINRVVSQLRKTLNDTRPYRYVELVSRQGYRLGETVEPLVPRAPAEATDQQVSRRPGWLVAGVAAMVLAAGVYLGSMVELAPRSTITIGVMPVVNTSGDPGNEYLSNGFKAELLQTLHRLPNVRLKNISVTFPDLTDEAIRRRIDADLLLNTQLFRTADDLSVYFELVEDDGVITLADNVDGSIEVVFAMQEALAERISDHLFGEGSDLVRTQTRTLNAAAYDRYMRALSFYERRADGGNLSQAIALFRESIELDPDFGPAHLLLAEAYALSPVYDLDASPSEMRRLAIETVEAGVANDSSIRDAAGSVYGFVLHKQKRWGDAEREFRRATTAEARDPNAFNLYSQMLAGVGRLTESLDYARLAWEMEPTSTVMTSRVALAATWVDDRNTALQFFDRTAELGAAGETHILGEALFHFRNEDIQAAYVAAVRSASRTGGQTDWIDPVFAAFADPGMVPQALRTIDAASADELIDVRAEVFLRTLFEDVDNAMAIAWKLLNEREVFELDILWIPEMRPLREHPEFAALLNELGIADYWELRGCQFRDDRVQCPDA